MAIKASGALSMQSDIVDEFGGTAPHAVSEYYRGGSNVPDVSGNNTIGTSGLIAFGNFYNCLNEILQALSNSTNVDLSSIFGSDWTTSVPKRCTIAAGVTIGGTGGTAAITVPSNMGGTLSIVITGSVIGTGGSAGGAGGDAISNAASGVTLIIESGGLCAGGGGGGGAGGAGGNGSYTSNNSSSQYNGGSYVWMTSPDSGGSMSRQKARWNGSYVRGSLYSYANTTSTSVTIGIYTYSRSSYVQVNYFPEETIYYYYINQSYTSTTNTTGGTGGAGGVGQGYNQSSSSGSAGSSGGTNAGAGGTGGSGNTYGLAGSTGGTGANGNAGNGSAGAAGGAAGAALSGTAVTFTNNGTVHGTVAT